MAMKQSSTVRAKRLTAGRGNIATASGADLNTAARRYAASQGWAMSDGSYPIRPVNMHGRDDLGNAVHAIGRGNAASATIKAHIVKRAKAIGATSQLPPDWNVKS
jgi:hypothetical protein